MTIGIKAALLSVAVLSLFPVALSGCIGGKTSCDFRDGSVNGPEPRCQERSGIQASTAFSTTCSALQGEAIDGACPQDGLVLGCDISGDGTVVDWYYAPKTEDEVKADCESDNGEIVQP